MLMVTKKTHKIPKEEYPNIFAAYVSGATITMLGKQHNVSDQAIYGLLKRYSIPIHSQTDSQRKYTLNQHVFDRIDSEEKAYVLGLLGADGYNNEQRGLISIHLKKDDEEILHKVNKVFGSNNTIKFTRSGNSVNENKSDVTYLRIYSKRISERLAALGIVQAKTEIYEFPEWLDKKLFRHYLRGYFDGDGCFSNKKSIRFAYTGTVSFCNKVMKILKEECNIMTYSKREYENKDYLTIFIHGENNLTKLIHFLYHDASIYLERKYKIAKDIVARIAENTIKKDVIKHRTCKLCNKKHLAKGMCSMHYTRYRRETSKQSALTP